MPKDTHSKTNAQHLETNMVGFDSSCSEDNQCLGIHLKKAIELGIYNIHYTWVREPDLKVLHIIWLPCIILA